MEHSVVLQPASVNFRRSCLNVACALLQRTPFLIDVLVLTLVPAMWAALRENNVTVSPVATVLDVCSRSVLALSS